MIIHIKNLTIDALIGILEEEKTAPQKLIIDIDIKYMQKNKKDFINYAEIVALVEKNIKTKRYGLLEDTLKGLKRNIKKSYPNIEKLKICLIKPDIITNCKVGVSKKWKF
ncbi:MAG: dihydroneopterin aldolase [Campylobacterales bacterium]|nr:dihydroneopterin aldolase [Campylobacterales bacterium]